MTMYGCEDRPMHQCRRDGGRERKLSGRSDSHVRVANAVLDSRRAGLLPGYLPAARSLAGFAQVVVRGCTVGAILSHRIGYPNTDSQYSVLSRFLSVRLSRPDSALSSSANHDSYRHTHCMSGATTSIFIYSCILHVGSYYIV